MLDNVGSTVFSNSESVTLLPVVSAEWNHNLFNPPYLTVAGNGTGLSKTLSVGTVSDVTSGGKANFTTKSFVMSNNAGIVSYSVTGTNKPAYKVITYIKTNSPTPVMISSVCKGGSNQYGSSSEEVDSLGWTKVVTYIGGSSSLDSISSFTYTLFANSLRGDNTSVTIYFTVPEIYETTYFDYQNNSLWPSDSVFTYFRPGESYIGSGSTRCSFPSNYRKVTSQILSGYTSATYFPISPIIQNPSFFLASAPVPILKNALATDISPYQYFISDSTSKSITALYDKQILTNKIVIKMNTLMTRPTIHIAINGTTLTVDGSQSIQMPLNSDNKCSGVLVLYWTGTAWTQTKWTDMPTFASNGAISKATQINKITVTQVSKTINSEFTSYSSTNITTDLDRMHLIEVSPRLEVDLTDFVQNVAMEKSLDANNSSLPISSINTNDATVTLSGIPMMSNGSLVPIFSSQSDSTSTVLSNMLRKNIKFYINFNLINYSVSGSSPVVSNTYIPGGVFYSDSWDENDIQDVSVQCFDVSRYLQSRPVPDYVANLKSVLEIITNILDLAGFTDYDYDSLYTVCNNKALPIDLSYYFCNSQDTTIVDALNKLFVAYQIGAYIDEYGIMKFLSLHSILSSTGYALSISDIDIQQGGLSVSTAAKPGKISLRYQTPKVKQSPSLQNVTDVDIKNSPSFIYTTSNDVVWQQQTIDSVGFNYLNSDMSEDANYFSLNVNDLLDIFHTFNLNNNGYAVIENEVVSFIYKEYNIKNTSGSASVNVSVKNNIELSSEINKFIKQYSIGLKTSNGTSKEGYDIVVTPTGHITNVQRGLFGTVPSAHNRISDLASKSLSEASINSDYSITSGTNNTSIVNNHDQDLSLPNLDKIMLKAVGTAKTIIYPSSARDIGYGTYSVKFDMTDQDQSVAGLFFNMASESSTEGAYFVELIRYNKINPATGTLYSPAQYKYLLVIYGSDGTVYSWSDVTGECISIVNNFAKIIKKENNLGKYSYSYVTDNAFNLKVVHTLSDGSDGESGTLSDLKQILSVFINNVEVTGWQIPGTPYNESTNPNGTGWKASPVNTLTGMRQKPAIPNNLTTGTIFGFYASLDPVIITGLHPAIVYPALSSIYPASLREIHATKKALVERSVSYFYQDREFLNGMVQNQPLYLTSPTYLMQTTPEVSGINYYDVQYTTPAAVSVDVLPIEYMWYYFPGNDTQDQQNYQKKLIDEYSLAYSTPINTGFRGRMAIANNSQNMVFLHKESDELNQFTINLNLWTHEIVAPSDPEIIERVIDYSNMSEVVQLDSEWIQSKEAAQKLLKVVQMGLEGFSKTVTVSIFGNPLIQVGDIIKLSYSLNGIVNQRYLVQSVSQEFSQGLTTKLVLKRIQE